MRAHKYRLYIYNKMSYFFVTTTIPEEDCIEKLKKMALAKIFNETKSFRITRVEIGNDITLYEGKIKATN